jgi:two-component system, chemotaxis family, chemotaxis protein CheY
MAKILIVDDSGLSRRISRTILESAGHVAVEAEDGIGGLEKFFLDKPDVVLLDVTMKGMNGIEVLKKLREMDPAARVIIVTADIQSSTKTLTQEAGASALITKPVAAEPLLSAIDAALKGGS